jgi:hypothetical protein
MHNDANGNEIHRFYAPSIDLEGSSFLSSIFFQTSSCFFHSPKVLRVSTTSRPELLQTDLAWQHFEIPMPQSFQNAGHCLDSFCLS